MIFYDIISYILLYYYVIRAPLYVSMLQQFVNVDEMELN